MDRKIISLLIILLFAAITSFDITNNGYETIRVGNQIWMKDNLSEKIFRNGDSILCAEDANEWIRTCENKIPAYCHIPDFDEKDGLIYNCWAIADRRNLAPCGWHIARESDWQYVSSIDSMHLDFTKMIYAENKLNIKRLYRRAIFEYQESFFDKSCFWAIGDTICDICVYESPYNRDLKYEDKSHSDGLGVFDFDIYEGNLVRCVKDN